LEAQVPDKSDEFDTARVIAKALQPFDDASREKIMRWARESLGMGTPAASRHNASDDGPSRVEPSAYAPGEKDIRSFVAEKNPSSDREFATTVAYYYRFVAPEAARKAAINAQDLLDACRLTNRPRFRWPGQTLINSHTAGLLDKTSERGAYAISTVGENLVAVTLPSGSATTPARPARKAGKARVARKAQRASRKK
jgi:hypothetical protein